MMYDCVKTSEENKRKDPNYKNTTSCPLVGVNLLMLLLCANITWSSYRIKGTAKVVKLNVQFKLKSWHEKQMTNLYLKLRRRLYMLITIHFHMYSVKRQANRPNTSCYHSGSMPSLICLWIHKILTCRDQVSLTCTRSHVMDALLIM